MHIHLFPTRLRFLTVVITIVVLVLMFVPAAASANTVKRDYKQTNLVSDIPGLAAFTDAHLVNPWGLTRSATSPWWVSDNGTGVSTLYNGDGTARSLVVTIPPPTGSPAGTTAAPTGTVFNGTSGFVVTAGGNSGPGLFLFATEDGTISGWNPGVDPTHAILAVDRSTVGAGAVYKGLTMDSDTSGTFIYATNFRFGTVEMFDANFNLVRSFTDPELANTCPLPGQCYAPFGIQNLNGKLYVTFALQDPEHHDDVAGPGHGFVDIFDASGNLLQRLASNGRLNSPWGLALAPANFGRFSNDLLVGNFGNGRINAINPRNGAFLGQLASENGRPITIDGLWALAFGNGANAGATNELFFTAGLNGEADGLFGKIVSQS